METWSLFCYFCYIGSKFMMLRYATRLKGFAAAGGSSKWLLQPPSSAVAPLLASTFHNSAWTEMSRKSGSKAMEFPVRPPSKKQLRKRRKLMEALSLKRDPVKEKIREHNVMDQLESMDVSKRVAELGQR